MSRTPTDQHSSVPRWVALSSLAVVLWLFFANAVPAMRERSELRAYAMEAVKRRQEFDDAITEARLGCGQNVQCDLQALLVAIDQLGFTPAELCAAYPATRGTEVHEETRAPASDPR